MLGLGTLCCGKTYRIRCREPKLTVWTSGLANSMNSLIAARALAGMCGTPDGLGPKN